MYSNKRKKYIFKILSAELALVFLFTQVLPPKAFAARSNAGGGDLAKFSWGSFAMSAGISVGSAILGGALGAGLNGIGSGAGAGAEALQAASTMAELEQQACLIPQLGSGLGIIEQLGPLATSSSTLVQMGSPLLMSAPVSAGPGFFSSIGNYFSSSSSLGKVASTVVTGYTTLAAASQTARAVSMAGAYYGWNPTTTFMLSHIATAVTGGFLNPSAALGDAMTRGSELAFSAMAEGAFVGGLEGLATGGVQVLIAGDRIKDGKSPGALAQIFGMVAGVFATNLGRTIVDSATYNTIFGRGRNVGLGWAVEGKTEPYTEDYFRNKMDVSNFENALKDKTGNGLTSAEAAYLINNANEVYPVAGGDSYLVIVGENNQLPVTFTKEQMEFASHLRGGLPNGDLYFPVGSPDGSLIAKRILINPFVQTFNQWPLLATRSLNIIVNNQLAADSKWRPFINAAVSATTPMLDNFANMAGLKPSIFTNIDEKLGYVPELQIQRSALFNTATVHRIAQAVVDNQAALADIKNPQDIDNLTGNIIPESLSIGITEVRKEQILNDFKKMAKTAINDDGVLNERELKNLVGSLAVAINDNVNKGPDSEKIFKDIGGSNFEGVSYGLKNMFTHDLPIGLISAGIQMGMDKITGLDKVQKAEARMQRAQDSGDRDRIRKAQENLRRAEGSVFPGAMLGSFGTVVATSIVRGVVWYGYTEDAYNRQKENIVKGELNPYEIASELMPTRTTDKIMAMINGDLSPLDPQKYRIDSKEFSENGTPIPQSVLQWKIYDYNDRLDLGFTSDQLDLSKNNLDSVRKKIEEAVREKRLQEKPAVSMPAPQPKDFVQHFNDILTGKPGDRVVDDTLTAVRPPAGQPDSFGEYFNGLLREQNKPPVVNMPEPQAVSMPAPQGERDLTQIFDEQLRLREPQNLANRPPVANIPKQDETDIAQYFNNKLLLGDEWKLSYLKNINERITVVPDPLGKLTPEANLKLQPGPDGRYSIGETMSNLRVKYDTIFRGPNGIVPNEQVTKSEWLTVKNEKISPMGRWVDKTTGELVEPFFLPQVPGLKETIVGSLSQGLSEFGWQSLAMGLPLTQGGKLAPFAWFNYRQTLHSLASQAAGNLNLTMQRFTTNIGNDVVERNILTTIADTSLGKALSIAPFVAVSGYKGMPFSVAAIVEKGFGEGQTMFYPSWPYQRLSVISHDPFWRNVRIDLSTQLTGQKYIPENNVKNTVNDPQNNVQFTH